MLWEFWCKDFTVTQKRKNRKAKNKGTKRKDFLRKMTKKELKKGRVDCTGECFFWCRKHLELGRYRMEEVTGGNRIERKRERRDRGVREPMASKRRTEVSRFLKLARLTDSCVLRVRNTSTTCLGHRFSNFPPDKDTSGVPHTIKYYMR